MTKEEMVRALALVEHQQRRVGAMRARLRAKRAAILAAMSQPDRRRLVGMDRGELRKTLTEYSAKFQEEWSTPLSSRVLFRGGRR